MTIDTVRSVLLYSGLINYGILILWVVMALTTRKLYHRLAGWFGVSAEQFDVIQYAGIMLYKLAILLFFLGPYVALRFLV